MNPESSHWPLSPAPLWFLFWDKVSLSPSVAWGRFKLLISLHQALRMLGLQVWTYTPGCVMFVLKLYFSKYLLRTSSWCGIIRSRLKHEGFSSVLEPCLVYMRTWEDKSGEKSGEVKFCGTLPNSSNRARFNLHLHQWYINVWECLFCKLQHFQIFKFMSIQ